MPVPLPVNLFCITLSQIPPLQLVPSCMHTIIASTAIENAIPAAPKSMLDHSQQGITEDPDLILTVDAGRTFL